MKSSTVRFFAVSAFFLLAVSVIWFIGDLAIQTRQGALEAEHSFELLSRQFNAIADQHDFLSPLWLEQANQISDTVRLVSAVRVQYVGTSVYTWDRGTHFIETDENGLPINSAESLFTRIYSGSLDAGIQHSGQAVLVAVMQVLPRRAIHTASRNLFLSVLTILLVTLIVIILNTNTAHAVHHVHTEAPVSGMHARSEKTECNNVDDFTQPIPQKAPEGLFSPITGIGWESYLEVRLDSELERATANELDVAFFLIRLPGVVRTDLISRKVIKLLLDLFKFRDLVFEYGTDGFAVCVQNLNLDQAMAQAHQLHEGIRALYRDLDFSASVYIGVTTRSSRVLPAVRMIEEAKGAVQKAESETDVPIVAYRVSPEISRSSPSA